MTNRKLRTGAQITLGLASVVMLYIGVLAGRDRGWLAMGFFLYVALVAVDFHVGLLLNLKIDDCAERLAVIISGNSDRIRLGNQLKLHVSIIFATVSSAAMVSLAILAGLQQHWLMLGVLWAASAVIHVVTLAVGVALRIQGYFERLEELICEGKARDTALEN